MQGFFQRFLTIYRPLISKLNELLGEYDLSYSLWQVIIYLKTNGPSSLVDISSHYNIEKPSVTRRVHTLEEKLIVKEIVTKNRREKIIQLTELGEEIYQLCREKITKLEYSVMKDIPFEEQVNIFEVLPKILENITKEKEK
ncbi:MarR family transcriptional regulator [Clostridium sp. CX1]|uniref:MarR family transcriptional regulator n=1 Tax=Clostridium tanneri TaxID=3037988 RepID=A0ABU4JTQ0_9CLOT|nr:MULTISPECIES: MarR family transcriptional regulator [unclassified Clostridium]MCT8975661.1 MarR family transcriptional regulator [Clostridium sp. CX1]MDW8801534.1 MarR family transcriptional regulator [Clostridium sp. A1-XYC3]